MIPSHKRLSWKDIAYMLRRGKRLYGDIFICMVIDQYPNRPWHQIGIQIPVKCDKRATMRNLLKRKAQKVFIDLADEQAEKYNEQNGIQIDQVGKGLKSAQQNTQKNLQKNNKSPIAYKKFFFYLNKKQLPKVRELLATWSKTTIVKQRRAQCKKDFTFFLWAAWTMQTKKTKTTRHRQSNHQRKNQRKHRQSS